MTDIVERLRGPAPRVIGPLVDEAADEIERLTAALRLIANLPDAHCDEAPGVAALALSEGP